MENITIDDIFTPSSPAGLTYIERKRVERQFKRAMNTKGRQIVVYGHTGSGKTTLLYNLLSNLNAKCITTRCTKGMSITNVLYDAFHQLGAFYVDQKENLSEEKANDGFKIGIEFFSYSSGEEAKESSKETQKRIVEIQKNPNQLAKLFGAAEHLWVIEDFHKLSAEPKKQLSQVMKVFMDVGNEFPKAKIVAVGAVDSAREVVHYDSEMENRLSEVNVPLMSGEELSRIIALGEGYLNIKFEKSVKEKIAAYSSGLASVTHQLCRLSCENKEIEKRQTNSVRITEDDLEYSVSEYVSEKSDSLKATHELAIKENTKRKHESPRKIIEAILALDKDTVTVSEILSVLKVSNPHYKGNNLRKYVSELTTPERGEILRHNRNADTYSFSNPFLRGYCHIHSDKYSKSKKSKMDIEYQDSDLLQQYLIEEYKKFVRELNSNDLPMTLDGTL